ncbi:hypothetical protein [Polynucleobacter antarcticus]|uniref:Uncharacterized protein n=1 Tax=Polynucleobacter antarcticus TaxID=1743162 RepID=A0A6M9PSP0_9BURK|nr:hypothetical protein [Polynucleobacter antarcticus]QKM61907.1 hypothetical protein DCO16_01690 [Polynucleobacter antarcticus]
MITKPNVYFVFPYRGIGGVPVLFVRIGEYLAKIGLIRAYFVDYLDGAMAKMRDPNLSELLAYSDDEFVSIPNKSFVVFQSMTPWSIFPQLKIGSCSHILFWNCHPLNLIPMPPGLRPLMQRSVSFSRILFKTALKGWHYKVINFLEYLISKNAIVFMDENNLRATEEYLQYAIPDPVFFPIPVDVFENSDLENEERKFGMGRPLRLAWVGRIVDFKFHILKRTLLELAAIQASLPFPIEIKIIGEGEMLSELKEVAGQLKDVKSTFINSIPSDELDIYLVDNVDLLLAMGTSALDGAKLGIPTILLDMSYKEVDSRYHYQWLYRRHGFTLGDIINSSHLSGSCGSLTLRLLELNENFIFHAKRSKEYVLMNHDVKLEANKFLNYLLGTKAMWGEMKTRSLLDRGIVYTSKQLISEYMLNK